MTGRQKILKVVYPLWIAFTRLLGVNTKIAENAKHARPGESIYELRVLLNNGNSLPLQTYKGKKLLLVNTASNCGYTNQYEELQQLYKQFNNQLEIIAFPANDFKEQEKGDDHEI